MNKAVLISLLGSVFISTSAFADVQNVTDKFKTVVERVPTTTQICEIVDVPIYGQQGSNTTQDILGGAIIGGIIGHQIGKGDQRKDNRNAGAILGGILGANKQNNQQSIVGYQQQQQCRNQTTYTENVREVYSHSVVTFSHEGRTYSLRFQK